MFEILKIPYGKLSFVIHILRIGLRYSTTTGFDEEREWLLDWCSKQQEELASLKLR